MGGVVSAPEPVLFTEEKATLPLEAREYADCAWLEPSFDELLFEVLANELIAACDELTTKICDDCMLDETCGSGLLTDPLGASSEEAPPQALKVNAESTKDSSDINLNHLYIFKYLKFSKSACLSFVWACPL